MMSSAYPVKFIPLPKERIWGGHQLKAWFDYQGDSPIGEYWVLSDHPNGMSVVANGEYKGLTLHELITRYPQDYLGNSPQNRFPLLIKFLDTAQDLSVQVHPDDAYAQEHEGDFGKTECWYILSSAKDGCVIQGHLFKNRHEYFQAVRDHTVSDYLIHTPIAPHQCIYIPSKRLHAILADTTLIEIQQTSDVTYRVYDWDRVDDQGNPRELHVNKAAEILEYNESGEVKATPPQIIHASKHVQHTHLIQCSYFVIDEIHIQRGLYAMNRGNLENPDILIVAGGKGRLRYGDTKESFALRRGNAVLIPRCVEEYEISSDDPIRLLRTYYT